MAASWRHVVGKLRGSSPFNRSTALLYSTSSTLVTKYDISLFSKLKRNYKYILDENLAVRIAQSLGSLQSGVLIATNPGIGVLPRALFKAGASHVIGLEPERRFHPTLWELQQELTEDKRFDVIHGDFSKIDPHILRDDICTPPAIASEDVLHFVKPQPWESDNLAARFVGIEAAINPSVLHRVLIRHLGSIAGRNGIFQKGRCELAFFYAEDRAQKITAQYGSKHFNRQSVMVDMFCDVNVLLREPCSLFYPARGKEKHKYLTLVSIVPKKEPAVNISSEDLHYLHYFIRLLMVKPKGKVVNSIENICPGSRVICDELHFPRDMRVGDLCTEDIGKLASAFFQWEGRSLNFFYDVGCNDVRL
ncbi:dimethyladenosine transferase 1, mitochondrial-like [Oculina patagonica]